MMDILTTEKWSEYHLYIVENKVICYDNEIHDITLRILATSLDEAMEAARDYLLSGKVWRVKTIIIQQMNGMMSIVVTAAAKKEIKE